MQVTVDVKGDDTHVVTVENGATYDDILLQLGFSPQEATVLSDGQPVPGDGHVTETELTVLRLVAGG
ncbi:hypothetical protein K0C01_07595 [Salinarchaeum sp. IM2453]|uniref:ubiquitin-like small modifier protein SAMP2 n=1 Tax=Salinarchaeum sp. IM2453 TaxID=2862870 RepID=UPI001C835F50|nr:ubiquitin-like small modifier protein 2 [Salinarchaeum sp. IM2453]QZA87671.1 hypothetical protein K0C01_07595 [Salinarchaeum sp. IM2453]